ncbi:MAG: 50S ribosomal protein L22 [Acidobacteriota bacterium]|nr:50S ribosomal protein L22 [Acidobacteriota bacterium]
MEAIAKLRNLKGSPRKARLVIDLIRGRNVSQALAILKFTDKRAADPIAKVLRSAIANATFSAEQQNIAIDPDDLFVKTCFVDMGPHKNRSRMRPAPQGRAFREHRHYCHITVLVSSDKPEPTESDKPRKKGKKLLAKEAGENKDKITTKTEKADVVKVEKLAIEETPDVAEVEEEKVEETENPVMEETVAETESPNEVAEDKSPNEVAEEVEAESEGEVSDAKNATTQLPIEQNETQPADEAQQKINEELERQ